MKLFIFIIAITIPFIAFFIGLYTSASIANILITPITLISTFLEQSFSKLPYFIHALLVFSMAVFYILLFFFSSRFFMKKLLNKI